MRGLVFHLLLLSLLSCVGTVQESAVPGGLDYNARPVLFNYIGLTGARGVAHDKIEVDFFPVPGAMADYRYYLYVNGSETGTEISLSSTYEGVGGRRVFLVTNLNPATQYKFKLRAKNTTDNRESAGEAELFTWTFSNPVTNFDGVSKVSLVPGRSHRAIRVEWVPPRMSSTLTAGLYDPFHYEVSVIGSGGVANINNTLYLGTDKRIRLEPLPPLRASPSNNPAFVVIDNLSPDTTYFVQVRVRHRLWQELFEQSGGGAISHRRDENTKFIRIRTLPELGVTDLNPDNLQLNNAPGIAGTDSVDLFWGAGVGNFFGYRLFGQRYTGTGNALEDDQLTNERLVVLNNVNNSNQMDGHFSVDASETSRRIGGLSIGAWYQFKVALCRTEACPVDEMSPSAALMSNMKAIRVMPTLANFGGINSIESPQSYFNIDEVTLHYDPPVISVGYATDLDFYCVNPANHLQQIKFNGTNAIMGSGINSCNGLNLASVIDSSNITTERKVVVEGLVINGRNQFCFAASPVITGYGAPIELPVEQRIVRCAFPEVLTPNLQQFTGLTTTTGCSFAQNNLNLSWQLPTGGVYSHFSIFYREKSAGTPFSFSAAISGAPDYTRINLPSVDMDGYQLPGLYPGRTYQVGIIPSALIGTEVIWAQPNTGVQECRVPLPRATFKGFSRILALGPKFDGRIPNTSGNDHYPSSAAIPEAINSEGLPFEVKLSAPYGAVDTSGTGNFTPAPGRDQGISWSDTNFDGRPSQSGAMSKSGIVSLAWENVELEYASTEFNTPQVSVTPLAGPQRRFGYRIYRSIDNRVTWSELTRDRGPIYTVEQSYRKKPNVTPTVTRMGFFTDYSVAAALSRHVATTGQDIDRARILWYRIVPVFDGLELSYTSATHHQVMVTLPPPNVALVHRWMANRASCFDLGREPDLSQNYTCPFNGVGAMPRSFPWETGNSIVDQRGDLLVDRHELGCRYTRGDPNPNLTLSSSLFVNPSSPPPRSLTPTDLPDNPWPRFTGFSANGGALGSKFRGCGGKDHMLSDSTGDYPGPISWSHLLVGDCMGESSSVIPLRDCTPTQFSLGRQLTLQMATPGLSSAGLLNCSDPLSPTTVERRLTGPWQSNVVLQSEFMAVYHNRLGERGYSSPVEGPSPDNLSSSRVIDRSPLDENSEASSNCWINLAAIDGSGYMRPRWVSLNTLNTRLKFKNDHPDLLQYRVSDITEISTTLSEDSLTLYNGNSNQENYAYRLPSEELRNSDRYSATTKLGKIMTSNSAKLPPLGRVNYRQLHSLCSLGQIEVGLQASNGVFAATAAPVSKRPLRRRDFVTASAWPDQLTPAAITDVERGTSPQGSCNSSGKNLGNVPSINLTKGTDYPARGPLTPQNNSTNSTLVTGSSSLRNGGAESGNTHHSQNCVSRYGIQDLVGNMREHNSERIFCDYATSKAPSILFTQTQSGWSPSNLENVATGVGFPFFNGPVASPGLILLNATNPPIGETDTTYRFTFTNGDGALTASSMSPVVTYSADAGYCSFINTNPDSRQSVEFTNTFGHWQDIFLPGGALNAGLVARGQTDQRSLYTWRNGDGFFLDFALNGLAPALLKKNSLGLFPDASREVTPLGKFFNPVLGLPLNCGEESCTSNVLNNGDHDNTKISTQGLAGNLSTDESAELSEGSFFVGNSQIYSAGIGAYRFQSTDGIIRTFEKLTDFVFNERILFSSVAPSRSAANTAAREDKFVRLNDFPDGTEIEAWSIGWEVDRNRDFTIRSGGSVIEGFSGRYSANFGDVEGGNWDVTSGGRCAVLINEN